jgi:hypothetical protein
MVYTKCQKCLLLLVGDVKVGRDMPVTHLSFRRKGSAIHRYSRLELVHQQRCTFLATTLMADRELDKHLIKDSAVIERNRERIGDEALFRIVVINRELLLVDASDLSAKCVNARIGGSSVGVRLGCEPAEDERVRNHVINVVVAVRKVVQRALLVDDAHGSFLSTNSDALDIVRRLSHFFQLGIENVSSLDGGLRMELGGIGDFEEDVLHNV